MTDRTGTKTPPQVKTLEARFGRGAMAMRHDCLFEVVRGTPAREVITFLWCDDTLPLPAPGWRIDYDHEEADVT